VRGSNGDESILSPFDLKPYPSIVGNGNGSPSQHCIIGGPWGLHGVCDALSSDVVLGPTGKFCRNAVFLLQVNGKGAFKGCAFVLARDHDAWPECSMFSVSQDS
jgi:hypothetical protein